MMKINNEIMPMSYGIVMMRMAMRFWPLPSFMVVLMMFVVDMHM